MHVRRTAALMVLGLALAGMAVLVPSDVGRHGLRQPAPVDSQALRERVAETPLDAIALRELAIAERQRGKEAEARALVDLGGRLGWRDSLTQWLLIDNAVQRGDDAAALRHIDALLRRKPALEPAFLPRLHAAAAYDDGRPALIARLTVNPSWRAAFFQRIDYLPLPYGRAHERLLTQLARRGDLDVRMELVPYVRALAERGGDRHARALWIALTGSTNGPILDPAFHHLTLDVPGNQRAPFEWVARYRPGTELRMVDAPSKGVLLSVDHSAFGPVLTQLLVLDPGRYRLIATTTSRAVLQSGAIRWTVMCVPTGPMLEMIDTPVRDGWQQEFVVPRDRCRAQQLSIEARRVDAPEYSEALFERIAIEPVHEARGATWR